MTAVKEIPYREPQRWYELLRRSPYSFFLDSGMDRRRLGRFSILGSDPFLVFKSKGEAVSLLQDGERRELTAAPFSVLRSLLQRWPVPQHPSLPVTAGVFGYFGYDLGRQLEHLPDTAADDLGLPDCYLGFYDRLVVADHLERRAYLTSSGLPARGAEGEVRAGVRLQELEQLLQESRLLPEPEPELPCGDAGGFSACLSREGYRRAISRVKEYIAAGDIFQANYTQRFSCPLRTDPWLLYRRLSRINPAPFAAYLGYPELTVASASPERYLQVRRGIVETRPIKGTRPRGRNLDEDRQLKRELLQSPKDRAELTMIIDLERNDLGRVCDFGSVRVPELITLEQYPTVFHLVSTVRGRLKPGTDLVDLLQRSFPGGSITGAPKIRAMEIIEELEPVKRGVYTGSLGYLGFDGAADLNIVIRTFVIKDGIAYFQVGGGIVADSDPDEEYRETIDKARALLQALGCAEEAVYRCQSRRG